MQQQNEVPVPFPFGVDFQKTLIKLLLLEDGIGSTAVEFLEPKFFESEPLAWIFKTVSEYRTAYGSFPSFMVLQEQTRALDPSTRMLFGHVVEELRQLPVKDEEWVKAKFIDWVRRNVYVRQHLEAKELFNQGKIEEAYDLTRTAMDRIDQTLWTKIDRSFFFEELPAREAVRLQGGQFSGCIGTGIAQLDKYLGGGGLQKGEIGIWIAYSGKGKSTMLINHGVAATRGHYKNCLHFVFEGSRRLIEDRYEAVFTDELYSSVKSGDVDAKKYAHAYQEYRMLRGKLVIRALVENFDNSILNIDAELKDLRRQKGWIPEMIVVDYGDLLNGRKGPYKSQWESNADAYRDLKILASRGYAMWTAAQAQRPATKNYDLDKEHLKTANIAGSMDKVRVADVIGSINQAKEERGVDGKGIMRLYLEKLRDHESDKEITIGVDMARMRFGIPLELTGVNPVPEPPPSSKNAGVQRKAVMAPPLAGSPKTLGYKKHASGV